MTLFVCLRNSNNPYVGRDLMGLPLGQYARRALLPNTRRRAHYIAVVGTDMPLLTRPYLVDLCRQMAMRGIPCMALGEGRLYAVGHGHETPRYRCGGPEATVVRDAVTYAQCAQRLQQRLVDEAIASGAAIVAPHTVVMDSTVRLDAGATVMPFAVLQGRTHVAAGGVVLPFSHLVDVAVGRGATVGGYHVGATVCAGATLSPYTASRGSGLGEGAVLLPFGWLDHCLVGEMALVNSAHLTHTTVYNRAIVEPFTTARDKEIEPC